MPVRVPKDYTGTWPDEAQDLVEFEAQWLKVHAASVQTLVGLHLRFREVFGASPGTHQDISKLEEPNGENMTEWLGTSPGALPVDMQESLISLLTVYANIGANLPAEDWDKYSGLDDAEFATPWQNYDSNPIAHHVTCGGVFFRQGIDLRQPSLALLPKLKWVEATFEFPLNMTDEDVEREQRGDNWWTIARDIELHVAGLNYSTALDGGMTFERIEKP